MKHTFQAEKDYKKLSECISFKLGALPIAVIRAQMRLGEVRLNGIRAQSDVPVKAGDAIRIFLPERNDPPPVEPEIVYGDENLAVVNKPVLCETETHLADAMRKVYPYAVPVHRLDRNTRGLVMFALNETAERALLRLIKARKVQKFYRARVAGIVKPAQQTVTAYLKKDAEAAKVFVSDTPRTGYLTAVLSYTTVEQDGDTTVLDISLATGRTHQIRAVMAHLGHPVIGDGKYGIEKTNRAHKAKYPCLLAYKLQFSEIPADSPLKNLAGVKIELKNIDIV